MSDKITTKLMLAVCLFHTLSLGSIDLKPKNPDNRRENLPYLQGHLLVKILPGYSPAHLEKIADKIKAKIAESYWLVKGLNLYLFEENVDIEEAAKEFLANNAVQYAEPDYIYRIATPNDPMFSKQWALENDGQNLGSKDADINASSAWDIEKGRADKVIGVIDTGIDYTHPDLLENLWRNALEIPGDGIDNDNNGYVDDIHGANIVTGKGDPMDDNQHGTHVAGIIGAKADNSIGTSGVAPNVSIVACKFLGANGFGTVSNAIKCMQYLAQLKTRVENPINLVATNNSWSGRFPSQAMFDAIKAHDDIGILFVAAAGNSHINNDTESTYPANYQLPNVISVAATDSNDRLASFSNFGKKSVHVAAPGVKILSTVLNHNYAELSGTSMAAPHVAGLAALIASHFLDLGHYAIKNLILAGGTKIAATENSTISGRRIRAADKDGTGSLTCTDQQIIKRQTPSDANVNIHIGEKLFLSAWGINCDHSITGPLIIYEATDQVISLTDDGQNGDAVAGDGIYSLLWNPLTIGSFELNFGGDILIVTVTEKEAKKYQLIPDYPNEYLTIAGIRLNAKNETIHKIKIPFPIHFADDKKGFRNLYVTSNGAMSFTDGIAPGGINKTLPLNNFSSLITPFWDDLAIAHKEEESDIYISILGKVPKRKLVVEWWKIKHNSASGLGAFQAVFHENSSDIQFNYLDVIFNKLSVDNGLSATIGIQISPDNVKLVDAPKISSKSTLYFTLQ